MYSGIETFGEVVKAQAKTLGDRRFIRFESADVSYREFHEGGNKVANLLSALAVQKGDRCAVMLQSCPEFLYSWLGIARLGAIEVPINTGLRGDLLAYILNQAECKILIIKDEWVDRVKKIQHQLTSLQKVLVVGEEVPGTVSFASLFKNASTDEVRVEVKPTDPSLILFTSGTTGPSKGAVLSHRSNFALSKSCIDVMDYSENDRLFSVFPLYHVNARYSTILAALIAGSNVVMHNKFSASRFWDICREEGITTFTYMGTLITILLKQPKKDNDAYNPVRMIQGAPCPAEIYDEFRERFNIEVTEAYGSTEVGICLANRAEDFRKGSCGKVIPIFDVQIHDEKGIECQPNVPGEIVVRPKEPSIMFSEYFGMPNETVKVFRDLWFHTGDRGMKDEDGYFYFVDRTKDVVRRRGENISSFEVERVLNDHPAIHESAIVGVPSELSEEEVLAVIQLQHGEKVDPIEVLKFCEERLPYFAVPRYVRIIDQFPKTPSQRIEKYKLRHEGITPDTWDRETVGYKVLR
ncbi:AMP-binding protein [Ureibacillus sp. NPDC094379]